MLDKDFTLEQFSRPRSVDSAANVSSYVQALEAFDHIDQLQELKILGREWGGFAPGRSILDVGCGFGLETLRLAGIGSSRSQVSGVDKSADFIEEARKRASANGFDIDFQVADATALPYADSSFDCVRAERLLIYLQSPDKAVREMKRVLKPGGGLALIEPDFSTTTINLSNRSMVRRALAHEADTAVVMSWLPGPLLGILSDLGLTEIRLASRVLVFPQDLCASYFHGVGQRADQAGAITSDELRQRVDGIGALHRDGRLFGSVGYFLFAARA